MKYSFKKGIIKIAKGFVIFGIPYMVDMFIFNYPQIAQLTIGAGLLGLVNFIKIKYKKD